MCARPILSSNKSIQNNYFQNFSTTASTTHVADVADCINNKVHCKPRYVKNLQTVIYMDFLSKKAHWCKFYCIFAI